MGGDPTALLGGGAQEEKELTVHPAQRGLEGAGWHSWEPELIRSPGSGAWTVPETCGEVRA